MNKRERLAAGETFITSEKGNSMRPLLENGEKHILTPVTWQDVKVGDIVYCNVKRSKYTHLVKQIDPVRGCLIGNNRGGINGWTKTVYGKVITPEEFEELKALKEEQRLASLEKSLDKHKRFSVETEDGIM